MLISSESLWAGVTVKVVGLQGSTLPMNLLYSTVPSVTSLKIIPPGTPVLLNTLVQLES